MAKEKGKVRIVMRNTPRPKSRGSQVFLSHQKRNVHPLSKDRGFPFFSAITKDMTIAEVTTHFPETMPVFIKHGMTCFGCPMALSETVEQGALAHGINADEMLNELNRAVKKKAK